MSLRRLLRRLAPALAAVAIAAAACGGGDRLYGGSATATRAPASPTASARPAARPDYATGETPSPSPSMPSPAGAPGATATQPPAPAPTEPLPPTEAPTQPPTAPGPVSLTVVARGIRFQQTELTVNAGAQVTLTFDNQDSVSHNVDIAGVAKTDIFAGPGQATITFTAPAPGSYAYRCDVHPNAMQGTLIVR